MKVRYNSTLISALLLSLCLVTYIPESLRNVLTWNQLYFNWPRCHLSLENVLMPLGFAYLGIVAIGLIVLWTGYRKRERWAWFVMLIILLCFSFPSAVLPVLLRICAQNYRWSLLFDLFRASPTEGWWHCLAIRPACCEYSVSVDCAEVRVLIGLLTLLVMAVALLLPVKPLFWSPAKD
jgi:hypothetical protein